MNETVVIGAGHMGSAIVRGLLRSEHVQARVVDPDDDKLAPLRTLGLSCTTSLTHIDPDELVVLAMPPQAFPGFAAEATLLRGHRAPIVSVMAGVRMDQIAVLLGATQIIRSIPNTPSAIFAGMTVFCAAPGVTDAGIERVTAIFAAIGRSVRVHDESLIDPATALCGGGPAFAAFFVDAMQRFGIEAGFGEDDAAAIAMQVMRGTVDLIEASGKPAMQVCREVMTPHGTTERGIWHFQEHGLHAIVSGALEKSTARSRELGRALFSDNAREV